MELLVAAALIIAVWFFRSQSSHDALTRFVCYIFSANAIHSSCSGAAGMDSATPPSPGGGGEGGGGGMDENEDMDGTDDEHQQQEEEGGGGQVHELSWLPTPLPPGEQEVG